MSTRKILTSHKGRKCKYPNCKRVLSIYNHDVHCHVHLDKMARASQWKACEK